ncbi:MAG: transporter [Bdellovibrionales bacterium]|nr:transporter [Bdellovibrionales bacterium]
MKSILFLSILVLPLICTAETQSQPKEVHQDNYMEKRIHQGDMSVDANFNAEYTTELGLTLRADLSYQYFFADKLSAGVVYKQTYNDNSHQLAIGPKFTYYFYESDRWAFYASQDLVQNKLKYESSGLRERTYLSASTSFGADYFLTPNVAIGGQLYLTHKFNRDSSYSDPQLDQRNEQALDAGALLGFKIFF